MKELAPVWPALDQALKLLDKSKNEKISLRLDGGLAYLSMRLALRGRPHFVVCSEARAETLSEDSLSLAGFFKPLEDWSVSWVPEKFTKERANLLEELSASKGMAWFGSPASLAEKCLSKKEFLDSIFKLKVGKTVTYSKLLAHLSENGYHRVGFVEEVGEFAVRGEVMDFWSANQSKPIRLVFSDDVVETMQYFDVFSQRTLTFVPEAALIPITKKKQPSSTLQEHFPKNSIIILDPSVTNDPEQSDNPVLKELTAKFPTAEISPSGLDMGIKPASPVRLNWKILLGRVHQYSLP